jgi:hypothetical protein
MKEQKIIDIFPFISGTIARFFRYDRWQKLTILKIEVELESAEETYLVLRNCNYLKFQLNLEIDSLFVVQESEWLTIKDLSEIFLVKCSAVELWSESDFDLYNDEIEETFKTERDEVTRRSLSIEDLDIN